MVNEPSVFESQKFYCICNTDDLMFNHIAPTDLYLQISSLKSMDCLLRVEHLSMQTIQKVYVLNLNTFSIVLKHNL